MLRRVKGERKIVAGPLQRSGDAKGMRPGRGATLFRRNCKPYYSGVCTNHSPIGGLFLTKRINAIIISRTLMPP